MGRVVWFGVGAMGGGSAAALLGAGVLGVAALGYLWGKNNR